MRLAQGQVRFIMAIAPAVMQELLGGGDKARGERVTQAVLMLVCRKLTMQKGTRKVSTRPIFDQARLRTSCIWEVLAKIPRQRSSEAKAMFKIG